MQLQQMPVYARRGMTVAMLHVCYWSASGMCDACEHDWTIHCTLPAVKLLQHRQDEHQLEATAWEASLGSEKRQARDLQESLAAALQESSTSQAALQALQQEARQQVHSPQPMSHNFSAHSKSC